MQIAILPYDWNPYRDELNIEGVKFVDVPICADIGNFPGDLECISDHIESEYATVLISTKGDQPLDNLSDYIIVWATHLYPYYQYGVYSVSYSCDPNDKYDSYGFPPTPKWTVCKKTKNGYHGIVYKTTDDLTQTSDFPNVYHFATLGNILPPGGIQIRCPDAVMQGLFIGIACDSQVESYIDFTCTVSGQNSNSTKIVPCTSKTVQLLCGKDETASTLTIEATSALGLKASKTITVLPFSGGTPDNDPDGDGYTANSSVTDIALYANPGTVVPGGRSTVEVSVNGTGNYSQAFTAKIEGNNSRNTYIVAGSNFCNVWVGNNETAEYVTVTATSVQDPTVTAAVNIYIDQDGTAPEPGSDDEQLQLAFLKGYAAARALFGGGG